MMKMFLSIELQVLIGKNRLKTLLINSRFYILILDVNEQLKMYYRSC